jgi:hypothetical protein
MQSCRACPLVNQAPGPFSACEGAGASDVVRPVAVLGRLLGRRRAATAGFSGVPVLGPAMPVTPLGP